MKICACMGPMRGDPYCPCEMERRGLQATGPSEEEKRAFQEALARYCTQHESVARDCSKCGEKDVPVGKYCKGVGCPLNPAARGAK